MLNAAAVAQTHYEVKSLAGTSAIAHIADEWRALCEEGPSNLPFYRPEWFEAYLAAFEPQAQIVLLTVREAGRLRAVLPLIEERSAFLGIPVKKMRSPTNVHSNRFDISVGREVSPDVILSLWQALRDHSWDVVELQDVPTNAQARELLACAAQDSYPTGLWETMQTPYVPLGVATEDVEEALGKKDSGFFSNLKKKMKKLEKSGAVILEEITSADQAALDRFFNMEMASWKGREGTAIACDVPTREFYTLAARAAARFGYLDIRALRCGNEYAAINYSFTLGGKHLIPKTTYSEKFSQSSPGQLIMREVIRSCLARGINEMDFLGPWAGWKGHWTTTTREHSNCYVFQRGLKGKLLHFLKFQGATRARKLKRYLQQRREGAQAKAEK